MTRDFVDSVPPATRVRLLPVNVVHPSGFGEAFEGDWASRLEPEPFADAQLSHCNRHRDASRSRGRARRAASCTAAPKRSSCSLTGSPALIPMRTSSAASERSPRLARRCCDSDRSFDCTRHRRERGHDAVAGVLHPRPSCIAEPHARSRRAHGAALSLGCHRVVRSSPSNHRCR